MTVPLRSLVEARTLAPLVMCITGCSVIAEIAAMEPSLLSVAFGGLGIPTLGTTAVAWALARRRRGLAVVAVLAWALAEALLASLLGWDRHPEEIVMCAAVASGITFVLAIPGWALGAHLAARKELDAGDTLLLYSALWFGLPQIVAYATFARQEARALPLLVAIAACTVLFTLALVRAIVRRRWYARVAAGLDADWSVRDARADERESLAPLFALGGRTCRVVVERLGTHAASPYRGDVPGTPVALVPALDRADVALAT